MTTKRARNHKDLVDSEKMHHHLLGTHYHGPQKTRYVNIRRAEAIESFYEWHKREKQNPELAQELNELFDWMLRK
ncbi:hypothetical protein LX03_03365 [Limosilactobacillus mucosae]|uniref:Uncharacterized protein n=1 Tax=Limosilactobacillus mucosae TaxID=97478 RepID=A0A099YE10_LIMMU|nr:hypothetical protein LX03_03365 [Limosilactobacillus mucosae]